MSLIRNMCSDITLLKSLAYLPGINELICGWARGDQDDTESWHLSLCGISHCSVISFYASAFRRQWHYVLGLSIRMKPEIPYFHPYIGPLVHPTNLDSLYCLLVRPSVHLVIHPESFPGKHMKGMAFNLACWCIMTAFRTDKTAVIVCWFSNFGAILTWNESIWGFRAFPGEHAEGVSCNFVCWCILIVFKTHKIMVTVFGFW